MAVKSFFAEENGAGEGAVIFGAGGAARSAAIALKELNFKVFICNRNVERAKKLVRDLSLDAVVSANEWTKLNPKIIVNATSVGMTPQENESPLDVSLLSGQELVLDFVHTPEDTVLVRGARRAACRVITGVRFFNRQADFQQRILLV
jgi:shikimate 5-dehydrogenase